MERPRKTQLYALSGARFAAPDYVDHEGKLFTRPADSVPLVRWPDGSWCHPANTFIRSLFEKNLSRRNRGGSLAGAASSITHLLRFCWNSRIDPSELTDSDFRRFVGLLLSEASKRGLSSKARDERRVISIGRTCLQFLDCVAKQQDDDQLIGPSGRIRAEPRKFELRVGSRGRTKSIQYWDHPALPAPNARRKRMPVSTDSIEALRNAIGRYSSTPHQRMRRHVTLKLMEITGARRGEIALITVESVAHAARMEMPMLRVPTLKKLSGPQYRFVPVSRADVTFLMNYATFYRSAIVRRLLRGKTDHGVFLVSETHGTPFQPDSITHEVRKLAKLAGIEEKACPHMFRHRFLTKLFVALIEQHKIENPDQFRRLLIDGEELKRKVAEWSGHSSIESLDNYIDLAFDEIGNFTKVYDTTLVGLAIDAFKGTLLAEAQALQQGEPVALIVDRLLREVGALELDLARAKIEPKKSE